MFFNIIYIILCITLCIIVCIITYITLYSIICFFLLLYIGCIGICIRFLVFLVIMIHTDSEVVLHVFYKLSALLDCFYFINFSHFRLWIPCIKPWLMVSETKHYCIICHECYIIFVTRWGGVLCIILYLLC